MRTTKQGNWVLENKEANKFAIFMQPFTTPHAEGEWVKIGHGLMKSGLSPIFDWQPMRWDTMLIEEARKEFKNLKTQGYA